MGLIYTARNGRPTRIRPAWTVSPHGCSLRVAPCLPRGPLRLRSGKAGRGPCLQFGMGCVLPRGQSQASMSAQMLLAQFSA